MENSIWGTVLATLISVVITLVATFLFNKLVALPQAIKKQKEEERLEKERQKQEIANIRAEHAQEISELQNQHTQELDALREQYDQELENLIARVVPLETAVNALPTYRQQSLEIQTQLRCADSEILEACRAIKDGVKENQAILVQRLDKLEHREKNALRKKILDDHRLFTDLIKNPRRAWSEMEHHSFFKLVEDYEDLGGNDYVHDVVLPEVNRLAVIPMNDQQALYELMQSRTLGC
jgi:heme exporter protein D